MAANLVARASVTIDAPLAKVWNALVNPETIRRYMFGTTVVSDWRKGSPILWRGEWQGRAYEDKGVILEIQPEERLAYSHFSPLAGLPDLPEHYHQVAIELSNVQGGVHLALSQDNNTTPQAREHSERNWAAMLASLKQLLES